MRVLLVNPPANQHVDQFDTPDFTRLGLAYLAGQLRRDARCGVHVAIIDAKFDRLDYAQTVARALAYDPDIVGLTAFTNEIKPAARVAGDIRRQSPSVRTVIGGTHVSALPAQTLAELEDFDIGVVGEGEITLVELVDALAAGRPLAEVAGLVYRDGDAIALSSPRTTVQHLDDLAPPAWDLLPRAERYLYMSQRGCPYRCAFCQNPNGRAVRQHSVARVVSELGHIIDAYAPREIMMCDEIFTIDRERTRELLDAMIAAGVGQQVRWWAQTHVNVATRALFEQMRRAGCYRVGLGIETGDADAFKAMHKGISRRCVLDARAMAADAGLAVEGLFIIGHPNETWQTAMRTLQFAAELNPEVPVFSTMVPYPGTEIAELARRGQSGYRLISTDWNDYLNQTGHSLELEHLTRFQIELLQAWGYLKVFIDNRRYADLAKFAWTYRSEALAALRKLTLRRRPPTREPATRQVAQPSAPAFATAQSETAPLVTLRGQ